MYRHCCPSCQKHSYSCDEISFNSCPYCGTKFSGKHGQNRRCEERIKNEIKFTFPCKGQYVEANTIELSERGLSINIHGEPQILAGDIVDLSIGNLQITAKTIWVNRLPDKSLAGLQKLNY